jgi:hypothetical protein
MVDWNFIIGMICGSWALLLIGGLIIWGFNEILWILGDMDGAYDDQFSMIHYFSLRDLIPWKEGKKWLP